MFELALFSTILNLIGLLIRIFEKIFAYKKNLLHAL